MVCETATELLGNYIDEDLTETMRAQIDQHLKRCKRCAADLKTLSAAVAKLAEATPIESPSPWFTERLLHRTAQETNTALTPQESNRDLQLGLW